MKDWRIVKSLLERSKRQENDDFINLDCSCSDAQRLPSDQAMQVPIKAECALSMPVG